jgi:hypothetical protein
MYSGNFFYIFLTVHLSITLVIDKLDARFVLRVYFNFNPLHVSSTFALIIRRVRIVLIQRLVYITLCEWPSGMQVEKELLNLHINTILTLLMMSAKVLETCRGLKLK